jgi:hypothetical protein
MSTAVRYPTLASTFKNSRRPDFDPERTYLLRESVQSDHGSFDPNVRSDDGPGAATVSMMYARIAGANPVRFGDHLRDICEDLATACHRPRGPTLTWSAAEADLPIHVATTFGLIADLLITRIYVHGFPPGRGGRIDASFTLDDDVWTLTIDDSGLPIQPPADRRCEALRIAQQAILRHTGWLETPRMKAGTRFTIVIPRSTQAFFHKAMSAALAASVPSWPGRSQLIEAVAQARLAIPAPVPSTPPNGTPTALADAAGL